MEEITLQQLKALQQKSNEILLIDVREKYEHEAYNIGGILVPLSQVMVYAGQIPKEKTVVFYCRKGIRSQIAIQRLQDRFGFTNLLNLKGGIGDGP